MGLGYILKKAGNIDVASMRKVARNVAERSGNGKAAVTADMIWCALRYQAGYVDYDVFRFECLNSSDRRTYVTRGVNNKLVQMLNDKSSRHIFRNKDEFDEAFKPLIARDFAVIQEERRADFKRFARGRDEIIVKPRDGMCGKGIEVVRVSDYPDVSALFDALIANGFGLAEELIIQHPALSELYSGSINTVRLVTVRVGDEVKHICAFLRMGNGKRVDNFNSGGMAAKVDVITGRVVSDACDKAGNIYSVHPVTGTAINGFLIPKWNECLALVDSAAFVVPQVRYVGWDIALTPDGPILVEGNEFPGHDLYQMPVYTLGKIGVKPCFEAALRVKL